MARQKGIIKLKGTIGGITFYKTSQDGHLAREKGGIEASRIASEPNFQRTRENNAEFGRAGSAGRLLRTSLRALLINSADGRVVGRLTKAMMLALQADMVNARGMRNVVAGNLELLFGFEFNIRGKLGTSMYAPFVATIDRPNGKLYVDIDSFVPVNMIAAPTGTTHYKIISGGADIDFVAETFTVQTSETGIQPWDANVSGATNLMNTLVGGSVNPLFLALGIQFYQEVNGQMYSLKNGAFNPLALVKVSKQ